MNEISQQSNQSTNKLSQILVIIFLVAILTGAAFVAGRWMNSESQPMDQVLLDNEDDQGGSSGVKSQATRINLNPAEELPESEFDILGMFVKRVDNSIFVGTGYKTGVTLSQNGPTAIYDGPLVEIVTTQETVIYRDETEYPGGSYSGEVIQQKVGAGSLDEIVDGSQGVLAWGRKVGDRLIAEVLLYSRSWSPKRPNPGG